MHRQSRSFRTVISVLATTAIAATFLVFGPIGAASAATTSLIALYPVPATPIAGQPLTIEVFTGAIDGSYPPGEVGVSVEGTAMTVGRPANTINGVVEIGVGTFPLGTITVDATFTPTDETAYAPVSIKRAVTIGGIVSTITPVLPSAPVLGKPVTASTILFLPSGSTRVPGGIVGFSVGGVSVGTCTPAATALRLNWSCSATLPAPTKAGPYTVTVSFGRSSYYIAQPASITATVAPAAAATAPKAAAPKAAAVASAPTPAPTATGSPSPAPTPTALSTPTAVAAAVTSTRALPPASLATDPWLWMFLGAMLLLIAAAIAILLVLRRRAVADDPKVG